MKFTTVDVINVIGAILVAVIIVFAGYGLLFDKPFYEASSYSVENSDFVEEPVLIESERNIDELDISNVSGRIRIEGYSGDTVRAEYTIRGPGRKPEVEVDYSGSLMQIKTVRSPGSGNFCRVDFSLRVPESLSYIEASSISGSVSVEGLENTSQKISTTSGSIRTDGGRDLAIKSISGSLNFVSSGETIKANTTSGRIEGELTDARDSGQIDIDSVSGSVKMRLPDEINASVNIRSLSGSISSDFPVSVTNSERNSLKGNIGNGGLVIEIKTTSGRIKLEK